MHQIEITDEMRSQAKVESSRRHDYITHHFEVNHLSGGERDEIGFLGEFACCELLGKNWRENIRDSYVEIDEFDIHYNNYKIDVKTETVPFRYAIEITTRRINDDGVYGRRLINENQWNLLDKYDYVIFGLFVRNKYNLWFPIGYRDTKYLLENYKPSRERPYGGYYPFSASAIKTSDLFPIIQLISG